MLILSVFSLLWTTLPAVAQGPSGAPAGMSVPEAQQQLDRARARLQDTEARLDELAATYESARSHAERLASELDQADARVADAETALEQARQEQAQEVRSAYMQPGVDLLRVSGAFLFAPDVGTALHASAMMQRVAANRAAQTESARRSGGQVMADVNSQRGIASGSSAAMQDVASLSATFTAALDQAVGDVARAETVLAEAQAAEAAEIAAAEEQARQQVVTTALAGVPQPAIRIATVNGGTQEMTCPLGQPNGFIDSWGFARSGGRRHQGVDMFASYGMPIVAAAGGQVRRVFNNALGGLSIDLIDGLGNRYYYAHLSAAYVVSGQTVQVGELIGANGNSGNAIATPPHLHWQFHPGDGGPVNPYPLAAALCR